MPLSRFLCNEKHIGMKNGEFMSGEFLDRKKSVICFDILVSVDMN